MSIGLIKNDKVKVISGKDAGRTGKVIKVIPSKNKAIVEGVAKVKKNVKPSQKNPKPGRIEMETPIDISNIMVICTSCGKPSRISKKVEDGLKVRVCNKCNQVIEEGK